MAQVFLVTTPGSNFTYTSDLTWNNSNNSVEVIGAGGAGAHGASTSTGGGGGGGGAYNKITNFSFATPGTTTATCRVGAAGLHGGTFPQNGGDTWFNSAAFPASGSAVGARGGSSPATNTTATGGAGGLAANGFPTTSPPGRNGGTAANGTSATAGGGGGGAGGPNGAGNGGSTTTGGSGDAGSGGAGGSPGNPGGTGGTGTEWDPTHGSGGGGGGSNASGGTGGNGGLYGGGAGGGSRSNGTGGDGAIGIIVLTWVAVIPLPAFQPFDWSKPEAFLASVPMVLPVSLALLSSLTVASQPRAPVLGGHRLLSSSAPFLGGSPATLLQPTAAANEPRAPVLGGPKQLPSVPPSPQGSPSALLAPPAQNPFIPVDFSKPFFPPPAQPFVQVAYGNFYPNPIPFGPYDYSEGPTAIKFIKPFEPQPNYPNFYPNPIPFGPYDYNRPQKPPRAKDPPTWSLNINLYTNPLPFGPYDYNKVKQPLPSRAFEPQPNYDDFYPNPIPFGPYDWNKPQQPQPSRPFDQQPNYINFYPNPIPFGPYDWSKTGQYPPRAPDQIYYNIALNVATAPAAPFIPIDWSKPFFPQVRIDQTRPTNINLFTNPIPFGPFDWSKPVQVPGLPPQALPYNLVIVTAPIQVPFFNPDFSKPYFLKPLPGFVQVAYGNFYPNPIPVGPYDWSVPAKTLPRIPLPPIERNPLIFSEVPLTPLDLSRSFRPIAVPQLPAPPYNVQLYSKPFIPIDFTAPKRPQTFQPPPQPYSIALTTAVAPFQNIDWSKPFAIRPAAAPPAQNLTIILPVPSAPPFIPFDWSKPYAIRPVVPQGQPNLTLYLPPPPFIGIPGLCFSKDIAVVSSKADDVATTLAKAADAAPFTAKAEDGAVTLAKAEDAAAFTAKANDSPSGQNWSGAGYMAQYEIDTTIELQGIFTNALIGVYADPTSITLLILDPAGVQTSQIWPGGNIVRDSLGHFHFTLTPAKSGNWTYKWQGTGAATATSPDTVFTVNASALIPG